MKSKVNKANSNLLLTLSYELWKVLSNKRKRQVNISLSLMILGGFAEAFSIASVVPLITVITNPKKIFDQPIGLFISKAFNLVDPNQLIIPISIIFIFAVLFASIIRLLNIWYCANLSAVIGNELSVNSYSVAINQPYEVHLLRNSSKNN